MSKSLVGLEVVIRYQHKRFHDSGLAKEDLDGFQVVKQLIQKILLVDQST